MPIYERTPCQGQFMGPLLSGCRALGPPDLFRCRALGPPFLVQGIVAPALVQGIGAPLSLRRALGPRCHCARHCPPPCPGTGHGGIGRADYRLQKPIECVDKLNGKEMDFK